MTISIKGGTRSQKKHVRSMINFIISLLTVYTSVIVYGWLRGYFLTGGTISYIPISAIISITFGVCFYKTLMELLRKLN